jgi:hypothetical protein
MSPNSIMLTANTLGMPNYKAGSKVWIVSLDPQYGRPFITGKITDDTPSNYHTYKIECLVTKGLSKGISAYALNESLGEMLVLDGITREDERVIINAIHEARMLRLSLTTIHSVGIGRTTFTSYPTYEGETNALRPPDLLSLFYGDADIKIIAAIVRRNRRSNINSHTQDANETVTIWDLVNIKHEAEQCITKAKWYQ